MRQLLLALLLFASPAYSQITEEKVRKMGNTVLLDCKDYGMESCVSRIIGLSACIYPMGVNQGIAPTKAQEISDVLFSTMTAKHKIPFDYLFNPDETMKANIRGESIERIGYCRDAIKEAIPVIYKAFNEKPLEEERIDEFTDIYPLWYINDMERVKRKYY